MKKFFIIKIVLTLLLLSSCQENSAEFIPDVKINEHKYVNILVSEENTSKITLISPFNSKVNFYETKYPKTEIYSTESNRFAGIINRENNFVTFFDTGLISHGDHIDVENEPKFIEIEGISNLPTHFESKKGNVLVFNDGNATLSTIKESEINKKEAKLQQIETKLLPHHGAMCSYSNDNYAITQKDNSITGVSPERVKIIDGTGKTLHESTIVTKGIHGNATDGNYAVFGSASGVLVVETNGMQKLINYPENFGTFWFGTIIETEILGKFIGFTANKGVYSINVKDNSILPIYESTEIMQCKLSFDKSKLGILLYSGNFKVFNLSNLILEKDVKLIENTDKNSTKKPKIEFTKRFIYVAKATELIQLNYNNLTISNKWNFDNVVYQFKILGFETSQSH